MAYRDGPSVLAVKRMSLRVRISVWFVESKYEHGVYCSTMPSLRNICFGLWDQYIIGNFWVGGLQDRPPPWSWFR